MRLKFFTFLLFTFLSNVSFTATVGIDLGTLYYKVQAFILHPQTTLVKPGKPLLIVENNASKRKTPTQVTLADRRIFQLDAKHGFVANPDSAFAYILPFLGKEYNSTQFQKFVTAFQQQNIQWKISNEDRQSLGAFVKSKKTAYELEEILAMILRDAKKMAEKMAEERITDCVVAIPPDFDQFQRAALHDSLTLAGMKPLAFVNENLAAAVRYAIDGRNTKNSSVVMYVNMGAASFKVSLVRHSKEMDSETKKLADKVEIIGEAWDQTLGGKQFDYEMVEVLADKFNALPARKGKVDVRTNPKAVRRLLANAEDLKEKLSAAKFMKIYVDSLLDYVSLTGEVTREEFEKRLIKFKPRVEAVIKVALKDAKMDLKDVDEVELVGSALRVPIIKDMISNALKDNKPNQRLNQEEAMSFGAGFLSASLSHSFKVKPIIVTQTTNYDISIEIANLYNETCTDTQKLMCSKKPFSYKNTLIKKRSNYDTAKSVTFPYGSDLSIILYEHLGETLPTRKLATFQVTGINEVSQKFNATPKVALRFEVNSLGIVDLVSAKAITEKIITVNVTVPENDTANETVIEKPQKVEEKHALVINKQHAYPLPMNSQQIADAKLRLDAIDSQEEEVFKRASAKNNYESLIYTARDWLNDEKNEKFIIDKVKEGIIALLAEVNFILQKKIQEEDWLYKSGDNPEVTYQEFEKRTRELEDKMKEMKVRKKEFEAFPSYVERLNKFTKNATNLLEKIKKERTWIPEEQFQVIHQKIDELKEWVESKKAERAEKPPTSDPVLTQTLIKAKMNPIRTLIKALKDIEKPKPEKKENKTEEVMEVNLNATEDTGKVNNKTTEQNQSKKNETDPNKPKIEDLQQF
eukprot:TRINITY_DN135161_c0_g1_i1.p1 TRINITY_DN135161_c0_g1~~TRINITY_DN135161_c0_g1_i1.p1  ORF type:complete len:863 (-),score=125.78 TRINITY_DN135161_c0_g1_i1:1816-4404(-)